MKTTFTILILITSFAFSNLYSETKKCTYSYNPKTTQLEWIAYKFTEKTGVKGEFKKIYVTQDKKKAPDIVSAMKQSRFRISIPHLDTGNEDRDKKIQKYFFGDGQNSKWITGDFSNLKNQSKGSGNMNLNMNGKTNSVPISYEINDNKVVLTGSIDVAKFNLLPGIEKLNEVCKDLHTGKDGKSKLWSEVDFKITSEFRKKCK